MIFDYAQKLKKLPTEIQITTKLSKELRIALRTSLGRVSFGSNPFFCPIRGFCRKTTAGRRLMKHPYCTAALIVKGRAF